MHKNWEVSFYYQYQQVKNCEKSLANISHFWFVNLHSSLFCYRRLTGALSSAVFNVFVCLFLGLVSYIIESKFIRELTVEQKIQWEWLSKVKKADLLVNLFTFRGYGIISEIINLKEEKLFSLMVSKVSVNGPLAMLLFWGL